jgi:uncharacterized protein
MKILLLLVSIWAFLSADVVKKVVFDLTTGDIKTFEKKVLSGIAHQKAYYEGKLEELEVTVVIHGNAYKFFVKDLDSSTFKNDKELLKSQSELSKRIRTLFDTYDVEFLICAVGMKNLKIDKTNIYDFVKVVATSTIGLIDKQNDGSAYIPIN